MERPDPARASMVELFSYIFDRLDAQDAKLDALVRETFGQSWVSISDICKELGCSSSFLYQHIECLPKGGVSTRKGKVKGWTPEEWTEHKKVLAEQKGAVARKLIRLNRGAA